MKPALRITAMCLLLASMVTAAGTAGEQSAAPAELAPPVTTAPPVTAKRHLAPPTYYAIHATVRQRLQPGGDVHVLSRPTMAVGEQQEFTFFLGPTVPIEGLGGKVEPMQVGCHLEGKLAKVDVDAVRLAFSFSVDSLVQSSKESTLVRTRGVRFVKDAKLGQTVSIDLGPGEQARPTWLELRVEMFDRDGLEPAAPATPVRTKSEVAARGDAADSR